MDKRIVSKSIVAHYHNDRGGLRRKVAQVKHELRELDRDLDYYDNIKYKLDGVTELFEGTHPLEVNKVYTAHWTIHNPFSTIANRMADIEKIGFEWRVKYHTRGCYKYIYYFDRLSEAMTAGKTFAAKNVIIKGRKKARRSRRCC